MKDKLLQWYLSPAAYGLWIALGTHGNWLVEEHIVTHMPSRICMWTSNWWLCFNGYRGTPSFLKFHEKYVLWRRYKWMVSMKVFHQFIDSRLDK
jgi:hypothetical protein